MTDSTNAPGFTAVLEDLDAGIFERKIAAAMAQTALAVVNADSKQKKGKVTLEFDIERISDGAQIRMSHKLSYSRPTLRGKVQETDTTETMLYVGKHGKMTITPDTQMGLFASPARETT